RMRLVLVAATDSLAAAWDGIARDFDWVESVHGDILDVECDAVVSPANSFGFMDGGIDARYVAHFGVSIQTEVRRAMSEPHRGELLVGRAVLVATANPRIPWLIAAPTMRVPMALPSDTVNPYLATRAVLAVAFQRDDQLATVAMPGMGTGVGRISSEMCARQV